MSDDTQEGLRYLKLANTIGMRYAREEMPFPRSVREVARYLNESQALGLRERQDKFAFEALQDAVYHAFARSRNDKDGMISFIPPEHLPNAYTKTVWWPREKSDTLQQYLHYALRKEHWTNARREADQESSRFEQRNGMAPETWFEGQDFGQEGAA